MSEEQNEIDWTSYYTLLGEFVVDFENIIYLIRGNCCSLVNGKGLKDSSLAKAIFGQKTFTAGPLLNCYVTIVTEVVKYANGNETVLNRLTKFKNEFTKLIESRNDILHSTHVSVENIALVGKVDNETEKKFFRAIKPSPNKTGYSEKRTHEAEIREYTDQLKELYIEFNSFVKDLNVFLKTNKLIGN